MFIPLYDSNSLKRIRLQYVTVALILLNAAIYFLTVMDGERYAEAAVLGFGFIPSVVYDHLELDPAFVVVPENFTFVTYAFLHGDLLHLGGNMLFLWVFGDNVEDALGHFRFLIFYLACAAAGAWFHAALAPDSPIPLIGASGAVAGIVAAYLILHPKVKVWVLAFARIPLRLPAWILLALWIGFQFLMLVGGLDEQVSFTTHVGGILAGAALVLLLRRGDQPVFDKEIVTPRAVETRAESAVEPVGSAPAPRWGRQ